MLLRSDVLSALAVTIGIGLAVQTDPGDTAKTTTDLASSHAAVSFANDVMPILAKHCHECHSEESTELGLRLDTYEGIMAGSDYGTVVEPGDPDGSVLIDMIESGDMPDEGDPVPPEELEVLRNWISEGAANN